MAKAILRRFRESPRKVRAVADMIRGRSADDALSILRMQQRKAATMLPTASPLVNLTLRAIGSPRRRRRVNR